MPNLRHWDPRSDHVLLTHDPGDMPAALNIGNKHHIARPDLPSLAGAYLKFSEAGQDNNEAFPGCWVPFRTIPTGKCQKAKLLRVHEGHLHDWCFEIAALGLLPREKFVPKVRSSVWI